MCGHLQCFTDMLLMAITESLRGVSYAQPALARHAVPHSLLKFYRGLVS